MGSLNLSRRSFLKTAVVTAAAAGLALNAESALAEAPYTAVDSAGEVKRIRSCCRGCGKMECGVWVTVENGRAVKIEGDETAPHTMGGTGRIWCMSPYAGYGPWFMSPNTSVAWQVCKGPRHFASALTSEYNHSWSATVERPPVFTIWASTPEGSNYDEAGRSVIDEAMQADTFISVDPRTTNLGKESDIHLALKGGAPIRRSRWPCVTSSSRTTWSIGSS